MGTARRLNEADAIFFAMSRAVRSEMAPMALSVLAGPIEPEAEAHQRELLARLMPNQRRRIVHDRLSPALPRWVDVPGAEPNDHWMVLPPPGDGTLRAVLDWTARWSMLPVPMDRPPWRSVRFDGVEVDGVPDRTVLIGQAFHAMIDAGGARRMLEHYFRFEEGAPLAPLPPREPLELLTRWERWSEGWRLEGAKTRRLGRSTAQRVRWAAREPRAALGRAGELVQGARRLQAPNGSTPLSPLLRRQSLEVRFDEMVVDVAGLKAGARTAGGTINDGYMAAMALGLRRWHRDHGVNVAAVRTGMAIDRRAPGTGWEGNEVLAVVVHLPLDDDDPARLVKRCGELSLAARDDADALRVLELSRAVGNRLPLSLAGRLTRQSLRGIDVSMSNSVGIPRRRWVGGVELVRDVPLIVGTLSPVTTAMYSRGDLADFGLTTCPIAVPDPEHLLQRLSEGFAEVAALAS